MNWRHKIETDYGPLKDLSFSSRLQILHRYIFDEVTKPGMDQSIPYYYFCDKKNGHCCCFGARVAKVTVDLGIHKPSYMETIHFSLGRKFMMDLLGLSMSQLELLLWACGAGRDAFCYETATVYYGKSSFSETQWKTPVHEVLQKMLQIKNRPSNEILNTVRAKTNYPYFYITRDKVFDMLLSQGKS